LRRVPGKGGIQRLPSGHLHLERLHITGNCMVAVERYHSRLSRSIAKATQIKLRLMEVCKAYLVVEGAVGWAVAFTTCSRNASCSTGFLLHRTDDGFVSISICQILPSVLLCTRCTSLWFSGRPLRNRLCDGFLNGLFGGLLCWNFFGRSFAFHGDIRIRY
jgi:hypothetical protein